MKYKTHVCKGWNTFILGGKGSRVIAVCGARVNREHTATPGVTKPSRPWCPNCLNSIADYITEWYTDDLPATAATKHNHAIVAAEMMRQERILEPDKYRAMAEVVPLFTAAFRPLYDRRSRTNDNRLFVVWSSLVDRCMDRTNPQYEKWGGDGWTVCERWIDFNNFVSDMPPEFTASSGYTVRPNGFSKELGPKSTVIVKKS